MGAVQIVSLTLSTNATTSAAVQLPAIKLVLVYQLRNKRIFNNYHIFVVPEDYTCTSLSKPHYFAYTRIILRKLSTIPVW
jgi:hypothetical protein